MEGRTSCRRPGFVGSRISGHNGCSVFFDVLLRIHGFHGSLLRDSKKYDFHIFTTVGTEFRLLYRISYGRHHGNRMRSLVLESPAFESTKKQLDTDRDGERKETETNIQTDRQTDRQIQLIDRQTDRPEKWTSRQTYKRKQTNTNRQTTDQYKLTDRQTNTDRHNKTDSQTKK